MFSCLTEYCKDSTPNDISASIYLIKSGYWLLTLQAIIEICQLTALSLHFYSCSCIGLQKNNKSNKHLTKPYSFEKVSRRVLLQIKIDTYVFS